MAIVEKIILRIKRREGRFYSCLHSFYKFWGKFEMPSYRILYPFLYYERKVRHHFFRRLLTTLYYEPMFRSRCADYGRGFKLIQNMPLVQGNLQIHLGDNVVIDGTNTFESTAVLDNPTLRIGSNTFIGYHVALSVGKEISIGQNCFIAKEVTISDNDGHPLDPIQRASHERVQPDQIQPVHIGDYVWIGSYSVILKGVTIGKAAIIGANSTVTKDIPPFTIAAGNPAKVLKKLTTSYNNPLKPPFDTPRPTFDEYNDL